MSVRFSKPDSLAERKELRKIREWASRPDVQEEFDRLAKQRRSMFRMTARPVLRVIPGGLGA